MFGFVLFVFGARRGPSTQFVSFVFMVFGVVLLNYSILPSLIILHLTSLPPIHTIVTGNQEVLLSKLSSLNVSTEVISWMYSYLANRSQRVRLGSESLYYNIGVIIPLSVYHLYK